MERSFINLLKEDTDKCTCCSQDVIELKGWLVAELEDEIKASKMYKEGSDKMKSIGPRGFADILDALASDEYRHFLELSAIATVMNEACRCNRG